MPDDSNAVGRQIRRAQRQAAREVERRTREAAARLREFYEQAAADIQRGLAELADGDGRIPLRRLDAAERIVQDRLRDLQRQRDQFIERQLDGAVSVGVNAWGAAAAAGVNMRAVGQETLQFLHEFRDANGLQLSDRLWRINRGAREQVLEAVESAIVQGNSAAQAARDLITRGEPVPQDLLSKQGLAAVREIQQRAGDSLLTGEGNPYYQAERVMRTEINRAYGETAIRAAAEHPDVVAVRFVLSPRHPKPDICDMHASANRHGLGPGVYPIDNHPWPAHPNTLSYLEPVFRDEITDEDKAGAETITQHLDNQSAEMQDAILGGKAKGWAWRQGHMDPRQVTTPWKKIVAGLQRRGIDIPEQFSP